MAITQLGSAPETGGIDRQRFRERRELLVKQKDEMVLKLSMLVQQKDDLKEQLDACMGAIQEYDYWLNQTP